MKFSDFLLPFGGAVVVAATALPVVDLGYGLHRAYSYNTSSQIYNFTNIRYARSPTGALRFSAPLAPLKNRHTIQDGAIGKICPQAFPVWYERGLAILHGNPNATSGPDSDFIPAPDPRENEDCLFLDVLVSKKVFEDRNEISHKRGKGKDKGAPVMVWIYGGGFTFGSKGSDGNPSRLMGLTAAADPDSRGAIYLAMNYRGGAFGFLSGPTVQADGSANAGLLDQRLALEWVAENIHLFGGDKDRVTVFGQSAGAGSILHQITAFGGSKGDGKVPFQKAILQSPGFEPTPGSWQQEELLKTFLEGAGVSSVQEARAASYEKLRASNVKMVAGSRYGSFTWAPVVDGGFVPALPGRLLLQGGFDKNLQIITGYNLNETLYFVNSDPSTLTDASFHAGIRTSLPDIQPSILDYISTVLYPNTYTPETHSALYPNPFNRRLLSSSEVSFACNAYYLNAAFGNRSYAYRFSVFPGYHGQDVAYTYFNGRDGDVGTSEKGGVDTAVAKMLQRWIAGFVVGGNPNGGGKVGEGGQLERWGKGVIFDLGGEAKMVPDPLINERCEWWQKALYY